MTSYCGICQDEIKYNFIQGGCPNKHDFHTACISRWVGTNEFGNCPICRKDLPEKNDLLRYNSTFELCRLHEYSWDNWIIEKPGFIYYLRCWICKEIPTVYQLGLLYENMLLEHEHYDDLIKKYPEYDANTLGLKFWSRTEGNEQIQRIIIAYVAQNHTCDWQCEELPCFLKRHVYC